MVKKEEDLVEETEKEYEKHPRIFLISFIIFVAIFLIVQSYFAEPRNLSNLLFDSWELILLSLILIFVFWSRKVKNLIIFGLAFLFVSLLMFFKIVNIFKPAYGTLFFLFAIWFIGDWINFKKFRKSLFTELLKGNYYIAVALFLSTALLGTLTELINIPFKLWWYNWPIPSIEIAGLPIVYVVFGWLPWLIAMFVIFYPLALKKPKRFKK